jgi:hypothetical protein
MYVPPLSCDSHTYTRTHLRFIGPTVFFPCSHRVVVFFQRYLHLPVVAGCVLVWAEATLLDADFHAAAGVWAAPCRAQFLAVLGMREDAFCMQIMHAYIVSALCALMCMHVSSFSPPFFSFPIACGPILISFMETCTRRRPPPPVGPPRRAAPAADIALLHPLFRGDVFTLLARAWALDVAGAENSSSSGGGGGSSSMASADTDPAEARRRTAAIAENMAFRKNLITVNVERWARRNERANKERRKAGWLCSVNTD